MLQFFLLILVYLMTPELVGSFWNKLVVIGFLLCLPISGYSAHFAVFEYQLQESAYSFLFIYNPSGLFIFIQENLYPEKDIVFNLILAILIFNLTA